MSGKKSLAHGFTKTFKRTKQKLKNKLQSNVRDEAFESLRIDFNRQVEVIRKLLQQLVSWENTILAMRSPFIEMSDTITSFYSGMQSPASLASIMQSTKSVLVEGVAEYEERSAGAREQLKALFTDLQALKKKIERRDTLLLDVESLESKVQGDQEDTVNVEKLKVAKDRFEQHNADVVQELNQSIGQQHLLLEATIYPLLDAQSVLFKRLFDAFQSPSVMAAAFPEAQADDTGSPADILGDLKKPTSPRLEHLTLKRPKKGKGRRPTRGRAGSHIHSADDAEHTTGEPRPSSSASNDESQEVQPTSPKKLPVGVHSNDPLALLASAVGDRVTSPPLESHLASPVRVAPRRKTGPTPVENVQSPVVGVADKSGNSPPPPMSAVENIDVSAATESISTARDAGEVGKGDDEEEDEHAPVATRPPPAKSAPAPPVSTQVVQPPKPSASPPPLPSSQQAKPVAPPRTRAPPLRRPLPPNRRFAAGRGKVVLPPRRSAPESTVRAVIEKSEREKRTPLATSSDSANASTAALSKSSSSEVTPSSIDSTAVDQTQHVKERVADEAAELDRAAASQESKKGTGPTERKSIIVQKGNIEKALAKHTFRPKPGDRGLAFVKGEIIEILEQSSSGWWKGKLGDRYGWVPAHFLHVLKPGELAAGSSSLSTAAEVLTDDKKQRRLRKSTNPFLDDESISAEEEEKSKEEQELNTAKLSAETSTNAAVEQKNDKKSQDDSMEEGKGDNAEMNEQEKHIGADDNAAAAAEIVTSVHGEAAEAEQGEEEKTGETEDEISSLGHGDESEQNSPAAEVKAAVDFSSAELRVAQFSYQQEEDGELSFEKNDRIKVLEKDEEEDENSWWEGRNLRTNEVGSFPANYTIAATLQKLLVDHDYDADEGDEISVKKGDVVDVLDLSDDWVLVYHAAKDSTGLIPFNHCSELIDEGGVQKMSKKTPTCTKITISTEALSIYAQHAFITEEEEIMGLLLGYCNETEDKRLESTIVTLIVLRRADKQKDRVEVSAEQLCEATEYAEELSKEVSQHIRVIGWYHSHPHITALPSHVDIKTQANYQLMDRGFVGLIFSCFDSHATDDFESVQMLAFQAVETDQPGSFVEAFIEIKSEPMPRFARHNWAALQKLHKTLLQEEQTAFASASQKHAASVLSKIHDGAVYEEALCRLLEFSVVPLQQSLQYRKLANSEKIKRLTAEVTDAKRRAKLALKKADKSETGTASPQQGRRSRKGSKKKSEDLIKL